jgi:serine/threonine protein kinase
MWKMLVTIFNVQHALCIARSYSVASNAAIQKKVRGIKTMLEPQTVLQSRYQINKQLGQGGMGAVYLATDQRFGSTVAVKETFFNDANLRKAFEREAKLLNSLRHPALPRVSDHFIENNGQFLVMEFIDGEDLGTMLETKEGGAFPVEQVLHWADQLLDALDYLHSQEPPVIHRDIKPQNLKLMPNGQIILLDFGLAKGNPSQVTTNRVTNTGSIFGYSRHYAPLEQIQGSGTDPRSDIYSLAATLYHLMTGIVPPDALSRATAIINGEPDPLVPANEVHAQVNSAVAEALYQAMSQTSAKRQSNAAKLRAQLREAASAGLTNEKTTKPFAKADTVLEQDTKIMGIGQTANLESTPLHAQQTVPMTFTNEAQSNQSAMNATVTSQPQAVSNPNPSYRQVVSNPTVPLKATLMDSDSEVTKLATKSYAAKSGSGMGRYLGIAAAVVLLLGISGLAYHYAFKTVSIETTPPVQQQNVPVDSGNTNAIQTTNTAQETKSTQQTTEHPKQQTTTAKKTNNSTSNKTQGDGIAQTSDTPTQPTQKPSDDSGHSPDDTHDPRQPLPPPGQPQPGQSPGMTDVERLRIEAERRRQIMLRRKLEQMRRRQRPPR